MMSANSKYYFDKSNIEKSFWRKYFLSPMINWSFVVIPSVLIISYHRGIGIIKSLIIYLAISILFSLKVIFIYRDQILFIQLDKQTNSYKVIWKRWFIEKETKGNLSEFNFEKKMSNLFAFDDATYFQITINEIKIYQYLDDIWTRKSIDELELFCTNIAT